jgi:divalent metal cation (Fe/Co/Zn/Cd) transporter
VTVLAALAAKPLVAAAKAVGGFLPGAPALLPEASHSGADSLHEVFLLASLLRSRRPADARHPFGCGGETYRRRTRPVRARRPSAADSGWPPVS